MSLPHIYADFNGIEYLTDDQSLATIRLAGYGTLASLSNQKIRLIEGMSLILYEPNDIEVEGVAHFDRTLSDPAGRVGEWVVNIDARKIRDCVLNESMPQEHLCFGCGKNLKAHLKIFGQQYTEFCPNCGTSIMAPMAPPENAT
jgi:predicted RNA-binding Zn-ribbon protein involved in translation (DUF1610 family)